MVTNLHIISLGYLYFIPYRLLHRSIEIKSTQRKKKAGEGVDKVSYSREGDMAASMTMSEKSEKSESVKSEFKEFKASSKRGKIKDVVRR